MSPLAAALSLLVGLSLGLLGGGGSILTLPILLYVVGLPTKEAIATSLLVVGGASFAAMLAHARKRRVSFKLAFGFGAASMTTAYLAGRLAHLLPESWLLSGFIATMLVTGIAMLRRRHDAGETEHASSTTKALAAGAAVGVLTGLVGAGGGFLIVPALTMFAGLDMRRAVGTSLLVITLNSLAGFVGYLGHVPMNLPRAGLITGVAALGSVIGSTLAGHLEPAHLRRGFAGFVLVMGVAMAIKQLATPSLGQAKPRTDRVVLTPGAEGNHGLGDVVETCPFDPSRERHSMYALSRRARATAGAACVLGDASLHATHAWRSSASVRDPWPR